jgi:hypothetical protein
VALHHRIPRQNRRKPQKRNGGVNGLIIPRRKEQSPAPRRAFAIQAHSSKLDDVHVLF